MYVHITYSNRIIWFCFHNITIHIDIDILQGTCNDLFNNITSNSDSRSKKRENESYIITVVYIIMILPNKLG